MNSNPKEHSDPAMIGDWFEKLESDLRPRIQIEKEFSGLQEQLSAIERQFFNPQVAEYTYQIFPELMRGQKGLRTLQETDKEREERLRQIFHLCNLQMQLMEKVLVTLELDLSRNREDHYNRGWMNLFRRWAEAPYFRRSWAVSLGTFSVGFQLFCEESLKLNSTIQWREVGERDLTRRELYFLNLQAKEDRFKAQEVWVDDRHKRVSQIWRAEISVKLTPGESGLGPEIVDDEAEQQIFPIGFGTIDVGYMLKNDEWMVSHADLMFYRIQDYYRQMRLLEKMIPSLQKTLVERYKGLTDLRVNFSKRHEQARLRYGHFFERYGFKVVSGR